MGTRSVSVGERAARCAVASQAQGTRSPKGPTLPQGLHATRAAGSAPAAEPSAGARRGCGRAAALRQRTACGLSVSAWGTRTADGVPRRLMAPPLALGAGGMWPPRDTQVRALTRAPTAS